MSKLTAGAELMQQLNDGGVQTASSAHVTEVRTAVTQELEELLSIGARIRPLLCDGKQVGWVRGVHNSERKLLQRWFHSTQDQILHMLCLGTSLPQEQIERLSIRDVRSLGRLVTQVSERDASLFPYIAAFVSTSASERLWHAKGSQGWENRSFALPDGRAMRFLVPSEHASLWAALCVYRENAKRKVDANFDSLMVVRAFVGRRADGLASDLKRITKSLQVDNEEPWKNVVSTSEVRDYKDGWAHSEDDSVTGLSREFEGMLRNDRHEQLIEKFYKQQLDQAEKQQRKVEQILQERGDQVIDEGMEILTSQEVERRARLLREGRRVPALVERDAHEEPRGGVAQLGKYQGE